MDQSTAALPGETEEQRDIRMNKDVAAFSYVWIMSILIYASRKDSKFIRYHAKQGIVLFLISIPVAMIPYFGRYLLFIVVGGMLLGFVHAAQGQYADVPIAGPLAKGETKPSDILNSIGRGFSRVVSMFRQSVKKPPEPTPPSPAPAPPPPSSPTPSAGHGATDVDSGQAPQVP